jgi:hypothetical protein
MTEKKKPGPKPGQAPAQAKRPYIMILEGKGYGPYLDGREWGRIAPGLKFALGLGEDVEAQKVELHGVSPMVMAALQQASAPEQSAGTQEAS